MLILAAPVAVVGLWLLALLLGLLRRWRWALVMLVAGSLLNLWTEQVPLNLGHTLGHLLRPDSLCFPACKSPGTLRILSYNICGKPEFADRHNQEFIDYVLGLDADILFLPENHPSQEHELDEALKQHYPYYMQQFEHDSYWVGEHTLYSRYPLSNPRFYRLDVEQILAEEPRLDREFVTQYGTARLIYQADADINGQKVTLVHVHLFSNYFDTAKANGHGRKQKARNVLEYTNKGYVYRELEARMICDSLATCPNPIIIAGDFNDLSGSSVLRRLQQVRSEHPDPALRTPLRDAWWEGGFGLGFTFDDQHLLLRLDHILYSSDFELRDVIVGQVPYSDHLPIVADFDFEQTR